MKKEKYQLFYILQQILKRYFDEQNLLRGDTLNFANCETIIKARCSFNSKL